MAEIGKIFCQSKTTTIKKGYSKVYVYFFTIFLNNSDILDIL